MKPLLFKSPKSSRLEWNVTVKSSADWASPKIALIFELKSKFAIKPSESFPTESSSHRIISSTIFAIGRASSTCNVTSSFESTKQAYSSVLTLTLNLSPFIDKSTLFTFNVVVVTPS